MKIIFISLLSCCSFILNAQIKGIIPADTKSAWTLKNFNGTNIAVKPDKNGQFIINIKQLEKGIYTLGDINEIYLEPDFALTIKKVNNRYFFEGKGSTENNIIQNIQEPLRKIQKNEPYGLFNAILSTEPEKFIPMLNSYELKADQLLSRSSNLAFRKLMDPNAAFVKRQILYNYKTFYGLDTTRMDSLRKYLAIPVAKRGKDYSKKLMEAHQAQFAKKLTPEDKILLDSLMYSGWDSNNELLFKNAENYRNMINYRLAFLLQSGEMKKLQASNDINNLKLVIINKEITNPYIKNYLKYGTVFSIIQYAKSTAAVDSIYNEFISTTSNEKYKATVKTAYANLKATERNAIAPDFNYPTISGEYVSLKSMRGKYVYIDLWATWCGPCIAEIPSLKKIEAEYKDNNIVFVSISVDTPAEKETWKRFVKENNLEGIQLMADKDFNSDFVKKFGVVTIPRFLLIGPDGLVIENDAKRPSDEALKAQLDKLLK